MICSEYCDVLISELEGTYSLDYMKFVKSHESKCKPVPLEKIIVALGVKRAEVGENVIVTDESGEETKLPDRKTKVTISVNIYAPYEMGERGCVNAFDNIADVLMVEHRNEIDKIISYETNYERETQSLVLKTDFIFNGVYVVS